jgi:Leucine-rich repeat (LRR) protein
MKQILRNMALLTLIVSMLGCNRVKQSAPRHIDVSHNQKENVDSLKGGDDKHGKRAAEVIDTDGDGKISAAEAEQVLVLRIGKIDADAILELHRFPNLERLEIREVDASSLDLSKNRKLKHLICCGCNITVLDLSKNVALEYVDCSSNQLTTLDVSKNTSLDNLYCDYNPLKTLYVMANHKFGHLSKPEDTVTIYK